MAAGAGAAAVAIATGAAVLIAAGLLIAVPVLAGWRFLRFALRRGCR